MSTKVTLPTDAHDLALWLFHNLEQVSRSGSTSLWEGRLPTRLDFDATVKHIEDVSPKLAGVSSSTTRTIGFHPANVHVRSEEHTSELQSLMRISYAVFCLKKKKKTYNK